MSAQGLRAERGSDTRGDLQAVPAEEKSVDPGPGIFPDP